MGTRRAILLTTLLLAVVLCSVTWLMHVSRPQEPVYEGRPLSFWLWANDPNSVSDLPASQRSQSAAALDQIGTNAIPTLMRMLKANEPGWSVKLFELLKRQPVIKVAHAPATRRNQEACEMFGLLGTDARNAVPALVDLLEQDISPTSRYYTIISLTGIGPPAKAAVPELVKGLTNTEVEIAEASIRALDEIHSNPEVAVPALIKTLSGSAREPSDRVRILSAQALGNFGTDAKPAVPALLKVLKDWRGYEVGAAAADALKKIAPDAATKADEK